ncbi:TlpA family protein disulfide reductase [Natronorubrum tibetense]|uniref:Alkyl hydroperoxide reductase/ thiol specific antioxidant/ Mal allergen n=1 Tax=Natronorubrum tibetense GA33 TaxID=1114856 RepID=L9VPS4_9EURY|nr:redoxin family protein [Natronorubrum tibetense]ELY39164.1 alkyl hydroperoxide reductase/ thiol specific antioxidant/ Mal allergen [Natronorubrum tibetense GA33]
MRRRDVLAGIGSAGVVAGAGAIAVYGIPSTEGLLNEESADEPDDPLEIETVDAAGSEAGTIEVPDLGRVTFVDLFGTWCAPCIEQMPALATANERIGDEVLFCSVTNESVGENGSITEAELVEWWSENDGNWTVGHDPAAELTARYLEGGFPTAVAIDASGRVQWADSGVKSADELVSGIEQALEADAGDE